MQGHRRQRGARVVTHPGTGATVPGVGHALTDRDRVPPVRPGNRSDCESIPVPGPGKRRKEATSAGATSCGSPNLSLFSWRPPHSSQAESNPVKPISPVPPTYLGEVRFGTVAAADRKHKDTPAARTRASRRWAQDQPGGKNKENPAARIRSPLCQGKCQTGGLGKVAILSLGSAGVASAGRGHDGEKDEIKPVPAAPAGGRVSGVLLPGSGSGSELAPSG